MSVVIHLCVAPADESLADALETHLRALDPRLDVRVTRTKQLLAGADLLAERRIQHEQANVILLLVSADFLASDECRSDVLHALRRHETGSTAVVPVLCRACVWREQPFAHLNVLPRDRRPICDGRTIEDAPLAEIVEAIRALLPAAQHVAASPLPGRKQFDEACAGDLRPDVKLSSLNIECSSPENQELVLLLFAANPDRLVPAKSDREVRQIQERLLAARYGGDMIVHVRWIAHPDELLRAMLDLRPSIVHFSGNAGLPGGLLEDDNGRSGATGDTLADLFYAFRRRVRLVVVNARDSESHAKAITRHIDAAIGMCHPGEDSTAIEFAPTFYHAIASGLPVGDAFALARSAFKLNSLPGAEPPILFSRTGVDLSRAVLFEPPKRLATTAAMPHAKDHHAPTISAIGADDRSHGSKTSESDDILVTTAALLAAACPDEALLAELLLTVGVSFDRIPTLRSTQARCEYVLLDLAQAKKLKQLDVLADALTRLRRPGVVAAAAVRHFASAIKDDQTGSMEIVWISLCRRGQGWILEFRAPGHTSGGTVGSARSARVKVADETFIQINVREANVSLRVHAGDESPLIGLKARVWTGLSMLSKHLIPWFDERLGPTASQELTLLETVTTWSELDAA